MPFGEVRGTGCKVTRGGLEAQDECQREWAKKSRASQTKWLYNFATGPLGRA